MSLSGSEGLRLADQSLVSPITEPRREHRQAVAILRDVDFTIILVWLHIARLQRSQGETLHQFDSGNFLTRQQRDAITAIQDCADNDIRLWLQATSGALSPTTNPSPLSLHGGSLLM